MKIVDLLELVLELYSGIDNYVEDDDKIYLDSLCISTPIYDEMDLSKLKTFVDNCTNIRLNERAFQNLIAVIERNYEIRKKTNKINIINKKE